MSYKTFNNNFIFAEDMKRILNKFYRDNTMIKLASENGLDSKYKEYQGVNKFKRLSLLVS